MEMKRIVNIETKDKKNLLNQICLMYKRLLRSEAMLKPNRFDLADSVQPAKKLFNTKSISIFKTILELLPKEQREIIEKDFIERENSLWYTEKYSKTKYYKLKNESMNNFLYLFYQ